MTSDVYVYSYVVLIAQVVDTTTIATMNKHSLKNKTTEKCHVCAELCSGHAPLFNS